MLAYAIVRLLAITLVIVPICTGLFWALIAKLTPPSQVTSFGSYWYLGWGYTLFAFTWSYLVFVLIPYSLLYVNTKLNSGSILIKFVVFYALMLVMGVLLPYASVIGLFTSSHRYPNIFILYLLLTLTICPLCNYFLNKIVRRKQLEKEHL